MMKYALMGMYLCAAVNTTILIAEAHHQACIEKPIGTYIALGMIWPIVEIVMLTSDKHISSWCSK